MSGVGLRERIYLEGVTISRGPSSVVQKPEWAETRQRYRDGGLAVHRLAQPYTGANERIAKLAWTLSWEALSADDVDALNGLIAWGGPIDFCPWLPVHESFLVTSGAAGSGTLARRDALRSVTELPFDAATRYATSATRDGSSTAVTLGTVAEYRTPWTSGAEAGTRVLIRYVPCYRVVVGENQPTFSMPHTQGQILTLEEV